jgi:hypothetical protein
MFSNASTFKVELDEVSTLYELEGMTDIQTSKILREAGPRSLIILDGMTVHRSVGPKLTVQNSAEVHPHTTVWPLPELYCTTSQPTLCLLGSLRYVQTVTKRTEY